MLECMNRVMQDKVMQNSHVAAVLLCHALFCQAFAIFEAVWALGSGQLRSISILDVCLGAA